jgi:hypothetical protein
MVNWESILHQHNIDVLHNGFEKCSGNPRSIKVKKFDVMQFEIRVKSDKWGNLLVADIRETDVYLIL